MTWSKSVLIGALMGGCLSVQAAPEFLPTGDTPIITITSAQLKKAAFGVTCISILGFMAYKAWKHWFAMPALGSHKPKNVRSPKSMVPTKPLESVVVSVDVQQQDGSYCGYHAAYNGITLLGWILGGARGDRPVLTNASDKPLFDLDGWKKRIIADRLAVNPDLPADLQRGMWLEADPELLNVVTHKNMGNLPRLSGHFTIIHNVETFHPVQVYDDHDRDTLIAAISALNTYDDSDTCAHLFLIANTREREGRQGYRGTAGHWIAVVVHRNKNQRTYYVMDSLSDDKEEGCKRDRSPMIAGLRRIVEEEHTLQLLQQVLQFSALADSVDHQLYNEQLRATPDARLRNAFARMEEMRIKARQFALFNNPTFRREYGDRLRRCLTTMEERITQLHDSHHITAADVEAMNVSLASLRQDF